MNRVPGGEEKTLTFASGGGEKEGKDAGGGHGIGPLPPVAFEPALSTQRSYLLPCRVWRGKRSAKPLGSLGVAFGEGR